MNALGTLDCPSMILVATASGWSAARDFDLRNFRGFGCYHQAM